MSAVRRSESGLENPFEVFGIGALEEQLYRFLLEHDDATSVELAQSLKVNEQQVTRALEQLELLGLATHTPERPARYISAPPDIALQALVHEQEHRLRIAQTAIEQLQQRARSRKERGKTKQMIEMVVNYDLQMKVFQKLYEMSETEVMSLSRPPERIPRERAPECYQAQTDAKRRGVVCRTIADLPELNIKGMVDIIRSDIETGENVRVYPELPFKLMIADRKVAIIPMVLDDQHSPMLIVRTSGLLDALCALFELLWTESTPILLDNRGLGYRPGSDSRISTEMTAIVQLLSAGLNDKTIAHEMNVSERTLRRKIANLMNLFKARTRFQTGWQAAIYFNSKIETPPVDDQNQ